MRQVLFACAAFILMTRVALGQTDPTMKKDLATLLDRLTQRIDALEAQHRTDQRRIEDLEKRIQQKEPSVSDDQSAREIAEIEEAIKADLIQTEPSNSTFDLSL